MIFRSPYPEVHVPEVSLTEFVFGRASERADKAALVDGPSGRALSYGRLAEAVRRAAAGLHARGFRKGDVLAIFSPNVPEYLVAFHAAATLGGVVTTVNPLYTAEEVATQLRDSRARFLLTIPQLLEKASEAVRDYAVQEIFVFGECAGATPFAALLADGPRDLPDVPINPREDLVALPYSSGTTGVAKGVMLTHHNAVANLAQIEGTGHALGQDTLCCVLPLFHIYGLMVIANFGLYAGATIVTLPRFDLEQLLRVMQDYGVTFAHVVPPVVLAFAKSPLVEGYDLTRLRTVFSGAAPLGADLARECGERLDCSVKQGYGMTETSPVTHMDHPDPARGRPGAVGQCVPNTECRIVDVETGAELGPGECGEIYVRGPQVMKGYLNCPEATAQTIDPGGWLHTGDIGYADPDGYFFIVDRAKELIKYKGFQVAPAELEALLLTHPAIADAAVIPAPDDGAGEIPKAFIVPRAALTAEEVMSFVSERVAPHKKIRRVEFVEQIPKSPSGKILRRLLRQRDGA